jgi:two-component system sensor histidine kinase ChiS
LAIVKGIVEAHHGAIWVEPMSEQGSVFRFTLPIVKEGDLRQNADNIA